MKVAVIGAGFTGLAAALTLVESGHEVEVFEKDALPGGLAVGFKDTSWNWTLEKHYHHLFTSDKAILDLASHVGHKVKFFHPQTSTWVSEGIFPLDSPVKLLKFPGLPIWDRLRTGLILTLVKLNPFWQPLEKITTEKFIISAMGIRSWKVLWEPLMAHKFGTESSHISAAWFWARVFKRSASLGYPDGGFQNLAESLVKHIIKKGGKFSFNTEVGYISDSMVLTTKLGKITKFDKVICTLPSSFFLKIAPTLPKNYQTQLSSLAGIGAVNLILSLTKPFLPANIYWLNVNITTAPFLCIVEHTNFITSSVYGNHHLLYIGNYQKPSHKYFTKTADELINLFAPYLKRINPDFDPSWINSSWVWKAQFAQPVIPVNYSTSIPQIQTPVKNLYLANIQQVYPWDRGTNYAVELGMKAAKICLQN